jgi:hypothetical protein
MIDAVSAYHFAQMDHGDPPSGGKGKGGRGYGNKQTTPVGTNGHNIEPFEVWLANVRIEPAAMADQVTMLSKLTPTTEVMPSPAQDQVPDELLDLVSLFVNQKNRLARLEAERRDELISPNMQSMALSQHTPPTVTMRPRDPHEERPPLPVAGHASAPQPTYAADFIGKVENYWDYLPSLLTSNKSSESKEGQSTIDLLLKAISRHTAELRKKDAQLVRARHDLLSPIRAMTSGLLHLGTTVGGGWVVALCLLVARYHAPLRRWTVSALLDVISTLRRLLGLGLVRLVAAFALHGSNS